MKKALISLTAFLVFASFFYVVFVREDGAANDDCLTPIVFARK